MTNNIDHTTSNVQTVAKRRRRNERGEGVISTAIAVLVVAFLGVGMWVGFQQIFDGALDQSREQVNQIGQ